MLLLLALLFHFSTSAWCPRPLLPLWEDTSQHWVLVCFSNDLESVWVTLPMAIWLQGNPTDCHQRTERPGSIGNIQLGQMMQNLHLEVLSLIFWLAWPRTEECHSEFSPAEICLWGFCKVSWWHCCRLWSRSTGDGAAPKTFSCKTTVPFHHFPFSNRNMTILLFSDWWQLLQAAADALLERIRVCLIWVPFDSKFTSSSGFKKDAAGTRPYSVFCSGWGQLGPLSLRTACCEKIQGYGRRLLVGKQAVCIVTKACMLPVDLFNVLRYGFGLAPSMRMA